MDVGRIRRCGQRFLSQSYFSKSTSIKCFYIQSLQRKNCLKKQEIQQRNWLLENGVFELIELIRVRDASTFFVIPTDAIAAQVDAKGRLTYPTTTQQVARPKSIGTERSKKTDNPETSRTARSPPADRQSNTGTDRTTARRRPSGSETTRGLPPLNPVNGMTSKPPPAPTKPTPRTKLPKLNGKRRSSIAKESKNQQTSLPPLSARSNSSIASAGQEYTSRKSSVASNDGRDRELIEETPRRTSKTILVADYGFLVVQLEKAILEWKRLYSKRILQVVVTWLRSQIDQMRYSVVPLPNHKTTAVQQHHSALFQLNAHLNHTSIELNPSLDDIQEVIHNTGKIMLCVAKGKRQVPLGF